MILLAKLKKRTKLLCVFFINTFFPIECVSCRQEDVWICEKCAKKIKTNKTNYCPACSKKSYLGTYCKNCHKNFLLNGVWIAGNYRDKKLAKLIGDLKYNYAQEIAPILGNFLAQYLINIFKKAALHNALSENALIPNELKLKLPQIMLTPAYQTIMIPVPLHLRKLKYRGFNQAELLATTTAKITDITIDKKNLIKIKNNQSQTKLKATTRKKNVQGAYRWNGKNLKNKNIILIDDVITTGATLNECANVLKKAGANEVWGLVLAKI